MPSGDAAHNAAHCEPTPGDWPEGMAPEMAPADAVSPDEPLDASQASKQQHSQQSSSSDTHAASRPADDPAEIKGVVRKDTLADAPQGADTA